VNDIIYKPIGIANTSHEGTNNIPIQPSSVKGMKGTVEVYPEFKTGLIDLTGFLHIILIYHFHLSNGYQLEVKPFLDENLNGVFATRALKRPDKIGLSVVKLPKIENNIVHIKNVDIINGTPLLDIKPFVPDFDAAVNTKIGWLTDSKYKISNQKSDGRFVFYF